MTQDESDAKIRARNFVYLCRDELSSFEMQGEHVARELPSFVAVPAADTVWDTLRSCRRRLKTCASMVSRNIGVFRLADLTNMKN